MNKTSVTTTETTGNIMIYTVVVLYMLLPHLTHTPPS